VPAKPATVAAPVPSDTGPAPAVSNAAELNVFFSRLRGQLWDLANALRGASHRDPLAYRLSRVASYLTLVDPLEHQNKVTALAPPSPFIVGEISALAEQKQWDKVLEIAEGSLRKSMYLLDLHRHVHAALGHLGESCRAAQAAVEGELASLIRRVPVLPDLKFQDGTPFADELTRSFLSGVGRGTGTASSAPADARDDPPREELEAASGLIAAGNTDQAIDAFHALLARIGQGRDRFRARLVMARACASAGSDALAVALFEGLVADLDRHGLDEWEPALASECLAGYHQLLKSLVARDKEMAQAAAVVYRRLCRVDPKRALSGGLRG
jgi:type VI secretion system protein VasJ